MQYPRTRVVNSLEEVREAARELTFPVVFKPNVGGRGAGIVRFETAEDLEYALQSGLVELGIDSTALVQEYIQAGGGHIVRVETLAGKFLYAMKVTTSGENFNLCPAEICDVERAAELKGIAAAGEVCLADAPKAGLKVERYEPPAEIIEQVERIAAEAGLDIGGVEYLIDERDGRPTSTTSTRSRTSSPTRRAWSASTRTRGWSTTSRRRCADALRLLASGLRRLAEQRRG